MMANQDARIERQLRNAQTEMNMMEAKSMHGGLLPLFNLVDVNMERRITKFECDDLKKKIPIEDVPNDAISNLNWAVSQFFIHCVIDTKVESSGQSFNRYSGLMDGSGVYPNRMTAHPLMDKSGRFILNDGNLQAIQSDGKTKALAADIHRVSENRFLSAVNLLFYIIHNRRMSEHGDMMRAKDETMALASWMCVDQMLECTEVESVREMMEHFVFASATNSIECCFGFGRYGHAMVPSEVWGRQIFTDFTYEDNVDILNNLGDLGPSQNIGSGISESMTEMHHVNPGPNIVNLNMDRHTQLRIAPWDQMVDTVIDVKYGGRYETLNDKYLEEKRDRIIALNNDIPDGCPIFLGMLLEAKEADTGLWGPIGSQLISDMYAHSCGYGNGSGKGLWHPLWDGAPRNADEIIMYALEE